MGKRHHSSGQWFRRHQVVTRILAAVMVVSACSVPMIKPDAPVRERYQGHLDQDPVIAEFMSEQWRAEGLLAMQRPVTVSLPYRERQQLHRLPSQASVFDFDMPADLKLDIQVDQPDSTAGGLIIELMRHSEQGFERIASMGPDQLQAIIDPKRAGRYRLRTQSILGSMGPVTLSVSPQMPLQFPVQTSRRDAVQSLFGAERDAGRRVHHGIDIFADRHTPVIAASDGRISRVATSPRGGLHIWQQAPGTGRLYYAHLQTAAVVSGDRVKRGQLIGTVGNSGNAISTQPHLHFGVYKAWSRPVDPLPLVGRFNLAPVDTLNDSVDSSTQASEPWLRVQAERLNLRAGPSTGAARTAVLDQHQLVQVRAELDGWRRVLSSEGQTGYVFAEHLGAPRQQPLTLETGVPLWSSPDENAMLLGHLQPGTEVVERGRFKQYQWIQTADGLRGWRQLISPADERSESALTVN